MKKLALVFALLVGCSDEADRSPARFDGTDPHGSIVRLTIGLPLPEVNRFRGDCLIASTGDASFEDADKAVEHLKGHEIEAFQRLNGMTANQIRDCAARVRAAFVEKR